MSKELLLVAEAVANEKGVERGVIFEALEAALASAAKKQYPEEDVQMRVSINRSNGSYETFRVWEVVADDVVMESPHHQIRLMDAVDIKPDAQVGEFIEEQVENVDFGRISAQAAFVAACCARSSRSSRRGTTAAHQIRNRTAAAAIA